MSSSLHRLAAGNADVIAGVITIFVLRAKQI
jgi:hypothetical protein